jgi:antitoxin component HigA of HigAB toxin-antitoxin module
MIENEEQYRAALAELEELLGRPTSPRLLHLSDEIEAYEDATFPEPPAPSEEQLQEFWESEAP